MEDKRNYGYGPERYESQRKQIRKLSLFIRWFNVLLTYSTIYITIRTIKSLNY